MQWGKNLGWGLIQGEGVVSKSLAVAGGGKVKTESTPSFRTLAPRKETFPGNEEQRPTRMSREVEMRWGEVSAQHFAGHRTKGARKQVLR